MEKFKAIRNNSMCEIVEKKSKFIGFTFYVEDINEVEEYISEIKKKYYDARHHVFAYSIKGKDGNIISKFSDDGEPSGTAGAPIIKIIAEKKLFNILVIVVRYFGGILLGTGGLVRSYSEATIKALSNSEIIDKIIGHEVKIYLEYGELEKLKYYFGKENIIIIDIQYLDNIEIIVEISKENLDKIINNKNTFKALKYDILKDKFIQI